MNRQAKVSWSFAQGAELGMSLVMPEKFSEGDLKKIKENTSYEPDADMREFIELGKKWGKKLAEEKLKEVEPCA